MFDRKKNSRAVHHVILESICILGTGVTGSSKVSSPQLLLGELIGLVYRLLCMAFLEKKNEVYIIQDISSWNDLHVYMDSFCSDIEEHAARRLWSRTVFPLLLEKGCSAEAVQKVVQNIVQIIQEQAIIAEELGWIYEDLLSYQVNLEDGRFLLHKTEQSHQKRTGAHYTPKKLIDCVLEQTLHPILEQLEDTSVLSIRVCDPSCGSGLFLLETANRIASTYPKGLLQEKQQVICEIMSSCIYGVDINPISVDVCILSLWWASGLSWETLGSLELNIRQGNSILDSNHEFSSKTSCFSWSEAFPSIFVRENPGFDCMIGNPPWISYSGRHAHPITQQEKQIYQSLYDGFTGWLALHSMFVEQGLRKTREHGYLGFVLPRQLADLSGYAAIRNVVRQHSIVQEPLADFGDKAFGGVEQPSFALVAQRRSNSEAGTTPFTLQRTNPYLSIITTYMSRLFLCEKPPKESFRDIGVHTGNCSKQLIFKEHHDGCVPIYEGKDILPFQLKAANKWLNVSYKKKSGEYYTIRSKEDYRRVRIVIRQTGSRPIAAKHMPKLFFRNSILACYGIENWGDDAIIAWLNSTIVAFFHINSIPEARQLIFPQIKIGHLRNLPIPVGSIPLQFDDDMDEQEKHIWIDQQVSSAFGFSIMEHRLLCALYDFQCKKQRCDFLRAKSKMSDRTKIQYEQLVTDLAKLQETIEKIIFHIGMSEEKIPQM